MDVCAPASLSLAGISCKICAPGRMCACVWQSSRSHSQASSTSSFVRNLKIIRMTSSPGSRNTHQGRSSRRRYVKTEGLERMTAAVRFLRYQGAPIDRCIVCVSARTRRCEVVSIRGGTVLRKDVGAEVVQGVSGDAISSGWSLPSWTRPESESAARARASVAGPLCAWSGWGVFGPRESSGAPPWPECACHERLYS